MDDAPEAEAYVLADFSEVNQYARHESAMLREEYCRSLLAAYTPDEVREQLDRAGLTMLHVAMVSDRHFDVSGRLS